MIEKIALFNAKMGQLGVDPNEFFVISFWKSSQITCQAYYSSALARTFTFRGFAGKMDKATGYMIFEGHDMRITLC